jgi:hypothetical protein
VAVVVWPQGGMMKAERDKVVREFRSGITKILISTDVLARGFDVSQVGGLNQIQVSWVLAWLRASPDGVARPR